MPSPQSPAFDEPPESVTSVTSSDTSASNPRRSVRLRQTEVRDEALRLHFDRMTQLIETVFEDDEEVSQVFHYSLNFLFYGFYFQGRRVLWDWYEGPREFENLLEELRATSQMVTGKIPWRQIRKHGLAYIFYRCSGPDLVVW